MKNTIIIIFMCLCVDTFAQTKKDPISLIKFSVDKTGKTFVKYSYLEATGVKYKIETKQAKSTWTMASEHAEYPMVSIDNGNVINRTDTFTLHLDKGVKQIRILFIEPKLTSMVTQTVNLP